MSKMPAENPLIETFEIATSKLQEFLRKNNKSANIKWIFKENILQINRYQFYKLPNSSDGERVAKLVFENGIKVGLGVSLNSIILTKSYSVTYVWHPADQRSAEEHFQAQTLKLRIEDDAIKSNAFSRFEIRNKILWRLIKLINFKKSKYDYLIFDIPSRFEILAKQSKARNEIIDEP